MHLSDLRMETVRLQGPVAAEALRELKLGDLVYLDGPIFTGREGLYQRYIAEGIEPPVPIRDLSNVNFHCSRAANRLDNGEYVVKAVTATASFRFGKWTDEFLRRTGGEGDHRQGRHDVPGLQSHVRAARGGPEFVAKLTARPLAFPVEVGITKKDHPFPAT